MKTRLLVRVLAALPLLSVLGFVSGCTTVAETPTGPLVAEVPKEPIVIEKEYTYVTRLGSHIPVRVPKSGVTRGAPGASPVQHLSPEVLSELTTRPMSRPR